MFPPAGGAGAGAWQLQQGMGVRAVAAADVVLGLATAAFALYAVSLNPADSLPQVRSIKIVLFLFLLGRAG